jgi:DNA polymerase I-like protein with 3'-5' exonuclease and polymerase domains
LEQVLTETERKIIKGTTKKVILEEITKWKESEVCTACQGAGCSSCDEGFEKSKKPHPASLRAQEILDFRAAKKEIEIYDKLLAAGRFHASFVVIGTRSSRMAGSDQLNPQGIKRSPVVRSAFPMADNGYVLCGGDFDGYEVTIMDVAWPDERLHSELLGGKKIHALFGECLFPDLSYDDILATKGLPGDQDKYDQSKRSVFGLGYGGDFNTLHNRIGIPLDQAQEGFDEWVRRYTGWAKARQEIFDQFCSMRQPGGLGTKVEWHEPSDYIESLFGFKRYFTLENNICRALFNLAEKPPKGWNDLKFKVVRRDRVQTVTGATRSALFACAFALQASNMRAAGNHVIQSTGAEGTKGVQAAIWEIQPVGIHVWIVQPFNVHDEVLTPTKPGYEEQVKTKVNGYIERKLKPTIPLIRMDWKVGLKSWADK